MDGNEYIDMLCAYGPIILGYVEPEINDAVKARMDRGFCFSLVQPYHHWYIAYRHTEEDLRRALEVVEEALAYVAEQYPWQR